MMKIFDGHYHTLMKMSIADTITSLKKSFKENNVYTIALLSCPFYETGDNDLMQNTKNLFLKYYFKNKVYAFAGLEHYLYLEGKNKSINFLSQVKEYELAGFDGIKMLEGKPCIRKRLNNMLISDESYDDFYSYLEEKGIPIILHCADPCEFWDKTKLSAYAIGQGWYNDESNLTHEQMILDIFKLLDKHPNLHLTLAHWGFLLNNYNFAEKFLKDYKYTMLDVTPAAEEYLRIDKNINVWRDYIVKYQDRIKYGTDSYNFKLDEDYLDIVHRRPDFVKRFLETNDIFEFFGDTYEGLKLDKNILEKIYYKNGLNDFGNPKKVNVKYLKEKLLSLKTIVAKQEDIDDINYMLNYIHCI